MTAHETALAADGALPAVIHCSRLPLAFQCPGSLRPPVDMELVADEEGEDPAAMGTAGHEIMADVAIGDLDELPDVSLYADLFEVDPDDLGMLAGRAMKCWRELKPYMPLPRRVEETLQAPQMVGTPDVWGLYGRTARLVDYKFGRLDLDHREQLAGYAYMICSGFDPGVVETVEAVVVLVREGAMRKFVWTPGELRQWRRRLDDEVVQWDGRFHVGGHCRFCPRQFHCPARTAMIQSTIESLVHMEMPTDLTTGAAILDLYGRIKVVSQAVEQFKSYCRQQLEAGRKIDDGNGRSLTLASRGRDAIDARLAWPILSRVLTEDELAASATINKGRMLEAVAGKAPARARGRARAEMMEALEQAGAVSRTEYRVLTEVRE
ncbi:MAG: DUF2800 domain-containing protein [Phycisphaerae bacterium]|nr:DUF2800 domain-containing protein [Phycisphaerae bacterium]